MELGALGEFVGSISDRSRAIVWVLQYLNHFQVVYELHDAGTLDSRQYEIWEGFAVGIVAPKGIRAWWDDESGKLGFKPEVRDLIDRKLDNKTHPPIPLNEMWSIFSAKAWSENDSELSDQPISRADYSLRPGPP